MSHLGGGGGGQQNQPTIIIDKTVRAIQPSETVNHVGGAAAPVRQAGLPCHGPLLRGPPSAGFLDVTYR